MNNRIWRESDKQIEDNKDNKEDNKYTIYVKSIFELAPLY